MEFQIDDLKLILPFVQRNYGNDFLNQIRKTVKNSISYDDLQKEINRLFADHDLNFRKIVADCAGTLRADESDFESDREIKNYPLRNEVREVEEIIDNKSKEFKQQTPETRENE